MPKLPVISGKNIIVYLELPGFTVVRIVGSHHRLKITDGRITTGPVHKNEDLPIGFMRKIIRDDSGLEPDLFIKLYNQLKSNNLTCLCQRCIPYFPDISIQHQLKSCPDSIRELLPSMAKE